MTRNTLSRSLHDLGLSAWFGGTLANAVALNSAASTAQHDTDTGAVANVGWDRWTPVNAAAIGAHLIGSIGQIKGNKARIKDQEGVAQMALAKTGLTAAALGLTAYGRVLGRKVAEQQRVPVASGTRPAPSTPPDVAAAQKQLRLLQWAIPGVTGALVVISSFAGEQERPSEVKKGLAKRIVG
ncbi:hypothetical protein [Aeromicrobium yanjiei]|uniref:Uncharacterized protein n=1 Tax=Aeromicrobium yanjiei TaxID=2662028 RepID=A0A5Q2MJG6_9ACTN|nr:hypothetical protein [Aeromicrobium yanjiei]QGG41889.1 hypothetical protein GEV26_11200 [Aeromicrobium yanjiei]